MILLQSLGKDQDIVQIYYHNIFHYQVLEDVIYYSLKDSKTVSYTKEHYQKFKKFTVYMEGYLLLII